MYKLLALLLLALISSHAFPHPKLFNKVSENPEGGLDVKAGYGHAIDNVAGSVFAAAKPIGGPVDLGVDLGYNANGNGLSASAVKTIGVGTSYTGSGSLNLLETPNHRVDANAFYTRNHLNNGPSFSTRGASLNYDYRNGLAGASLIGSQTPKFGMSSLDFKGSTNLIKSGPWSVDAHAGVGKSFSPGFSSRPNYNAGITGTYKFG